MELVVKHFSELSAEELFEIYKLRVSVFVVEQNCPYQEVDDADRVAYHLWLKDEDGIEAYARVLPRARRSLLRRLAVSLRSNVAAGWAAKLWKRRLTSPKRNFGRKNLRSKRRFTPARCMKSTDSIRLLKNFWKMGFRISKCS